MLWSRSASLMMTTRTSSAMARKSLVRFSFCSCFLVTYSFCPDRVSLVTPSTRWATSGENRLAISSTVMFLPSSTVSWSTPAMTVAASMPMSSRYSDTAMGWTM